MFASNNSNREQDDLIAFFHNTIDQTKWIKSSFTFSVDRNEMRPKTNEFIEKFSNMF